MSDAIAEAVAEALGVGAVSCDAVGGGCVAEASRVGLADGRRVFAKRLPDAGAGVLEAEADGLRELGEVSARLGAGDRIATPGVLHAGANLLVLEWLELGGPRVGDATWGRRLAAFHRASAAGSHAGYGADQDRPLGATPQDNRRLHDWPTFWRDRRLVPMLDALGAAGRGGGLVDRGRRLAERIPEILGGADETPCLLHGDLWSSNLGSVGGEPVWFDPSPYTGSREAEFGMTRMFGGFGPAFEAAYREAWPLPDPDGFDRRVGVYELHHHLNHLLLFGEGYRAGCERRMARLLRG
ncbi:fructosamine kinase family protein [Phycisphaera mikurensis]|uniref:Putative phosphotransferase n=1 Tax=Phycisphaera mikurensis (strain NBRC 102666 / KCTC 22515 / FYK2301M01) TaxID=1142394 RepID=I0IHJ9_PHYMF|nr:fructosamine kinase family protein [Phycisphaera mikurensis]MBB6440982.1 fructosamine-3-kinase [Phycisphaera mikurensis]BAM04737.1 putative phosphotransferase [Phycisphaera mikurensis NBRC 102666]